MIVVVTYTRRLFGRLTVILWACAHHLARTHDPELGGRPFLKIQANLLTQSNGNIRCQPLGLHRKPEDEMYLEDHQQDITNFERGGTVATLVTLLAATSASCAVE